MAISVPRYSVDDLEHFPEDGNRYELLDGVLLVTPAPGNLHQVLATRLLVMLSVVLTPRMLAYVVGPGVVTREPFTQLEPDVFVYPARFLPGSKWQDITERWLAVEIISRSSRVYDREFKRDAYFALGVQEVWLVDPRMRSVEVCHERGDGSIETDGFTWRVPDADLDIVIDVKELFAGVD